MQAYCVKYMRLFGSLGLLIVLVVVAVGCTSVPKVLETEPDFTGFITAVHPIGVEDTFGQILAESHAANLVDKYMVTIKDKTLIIEQGGEELRQLTFEVLETKQRVQLWFTGPV